MVLPAVSVTVRSGTSAEIAGMELGNSADGSLTVQVLAEVELDEEAGEHLSEHVLAETGGFCTEHLSLQSR